MPNVLFKFIIKIYNMQDNLKKIKKDFIPILGEIIKSHRKNLKKSVYMISAEAFTPRSTWRDVEFGTSKNINLSTFCKIAEGLNMEPWELLKELCEKLGKDFAFTDLD